MKKIFFLLFFSQIFNYSIIAQNEILSDLSPEELLSDPIYETNETTSNNFIDQKLEQSLKNIPIIDLASFTNQNIATKEPSFYDNNVMAKSTQFINAPFSVNYIGMNSGSITVEDLIFSEGMQAMCTDNVFSIPNLALGIPFARMYRTVNMASAKTSLLRDGKKLGADEDLALKNSLETFYGYGNNKIDDVYDQSFRQNLYSGASLNLMSSFDQCVRKVALFQFAKDRGYPLDQKIRNTNWVLKDIMDNFYQKYPDMANTQKRQKLVGDKHPCQEILSYQGVEQQMIDLQKGIAYFPLYLDRAYRYAFLVEVITLSDSTTYRPSGDWVRVMAFKVPDVAANKPDGTIEGIYNDPIHYLADSLITPREQAFYSEKINIEKEKIAQAQINESNKLINCVGEACNDPLSKAILELIEKTNVVNIFNTRYLWHEKDHGVMACRNEPYPYEEVKKIQDLAALGKVTPPLFTAPANQIEKPGEGIWHFGNTTKIGQIRRWIVHPYGWDMEYIEDVIKGSFFKPEEKDQYYRDWECHIRLPIKEISVKHELGYFPAYITSIKNNNSQNTVIIKEANKTKDDGDQGTITTLGGKLGFLTHFSQKFLQNKNSKQYQYLSTCETTEDYLLEECKNPPEKCPTPMPTPTPAAEVCASQSVAGGQNFKTIEKFYRTFGDGPVCITWDMYTLPDKIEVWLDDNQIFKSNGPCQQSAYGQLPNPGEGCEDYISGDGSFTFDYVAGQKIKILIGGVIGSTQWVMRITCPNAGCWYF